MKIIRSHLDDLEKELQKALIKIKKKSSQGRLETSDDKLVNLVSKIENNSKEINKILKSLSKKIPKTLEKIEIEKEIQRKDENENQEAQIEFEQWLNKAISEPMKLCLPGYNVNIEKYQNKHQDECKSSKKARKEDKSEKRKYR